MYLGKTFLDHLNHKKLALLLHLDNILMRTQNMFFLAIVIEGMEVILMNLQKIAIATYLHLNTTIKMDLPM